MRDHWSIGFVAEKMDSQFERDIGLLRRAVAVDNKAQKQYNFVTELKRHSCHVHNKLRDRHGAIRDLHNHIEGLSRDEFNIISQISPENFGPKSEPSFLELQKVVRISIV